MSDAKALRLRCHGERQNQQARGVAPPVARPRCTRSHALHLNVVCVMVTGSVVSTSLAAKTLRRRWSLWVSVSARELTSTTRCSQLCSPLGRFRAHSRHTRPADPFAAARRPVGGRLHCDPQTGAHGLGHIDVADRRRSATKSLERLRDRMSAVHCVELTPAHDVASNHSPAAVMTASRLHG